MRNLMLGCLFGLFACGNGSGSAHDAAPLADGNFSGVDGSASGDGGGDVVDAGGGITDAGAPDAFPGVFEIIIVANDDCTITTIPPSITVPAGTDFTVRWTNSATSDVEVDIAKIDMFNQVPLILGLEPAMSLPDDVHHWCGSIFTGTFDFRVTSCDQPYYLPVDCGGT